LDLRIFIFQLKKKDFHFHQNRFPKKPRHSDFAQSFLIVFHCALDFFGRWPIQKSYFLSGFSLAIFQKNEHSLVAIEQIITFYFFFNGFVQKNKQRFKARRFFATGCNFVKIFLCKVINKLNFRSALAVALAF
jgi:hypothetical protein